MRVGHRLAVAGSAVAVTVVLSVVVSTAYGSNDGEQESGGRPAPLASDEASASAEAVEGSDRRSAAGPNALEAAAQQAEVQSDRATEQTPLQEFFGVPVDPSAAMEWDHDMIERGIAECMSARGWEYRPVAFEASVTEGLSSDSATAANDSYVTALTPERRAAYTTDLAGYPSGERVPCQDEAMNRAHPLNALQVEYDAMLAEAWAVPELVVANNTWADCLGLSQSSPPEDFIEIDPADQARCDTLSGRSEIMAGVMNEIEQSFIENHHARLTELRADRP